MVVTIGATVTLDPDKFPGFQVYVVAPPVDSVAVAPTQIEGGVAIGLIVGVILTETIATAVAVHAKIFEPVTV